MSTPAIIYIILTVIGFFVAIDRNGKPKTGVYDFYETFFATALIAGLLYWGGFFS